MRNPPAWQLILQAAESLTTSGQSPFSLDTLIRKVQSLDPIRGRDSISPVVQGMTANAPGGPPSPCGEVLWRVDRGIYRLISDKEQRSPSIPLDLDEERTGFSDEPASDPITYLQTLHANHQGFGEVASVIAGKEQVLQRYGAMFDPANLSNLTAEDFKGFLLYDNNRHWWGIHRQQALITSDMDRLRRALALLLDESRPIASRLDQLVRTGEANYVPGLGKAVLTPILLVVYPDRYGAWNATTESAMKNLGLWPDFPRGSSFGERYERLNEVLKETAEVVGVDLWTLDALWWAAEQSTSGLSGSLPPGDGDGGIETPLSPGISFSLERHLHEFLRDNWDRTELGVEWRLFEEGGDVVGYEYPTGVGRIDLLAKHRSEARWLVIELKRDRLSDVTVGQVARYVGWVKRNLAEPTDTVEGMVIAREADPQIQYALDVVPGVSLRTYEVEFHLRRPSF